MIPSVKIVKFKIRIFSGSNQFLIDVEWRITWKYVQCPFKPFFLFENGKTLLYCPGIYPDSQQYPLNLIYPDSQQYPLNLIYPDSQQYPLNLIYPDSQQYPLNLIYPDSQQNPLNLSWIKANGLLLLYSTKTPCNRKKKLF